MTFFVILALFLLVGLAASRFGADSRVDREWMRHDPHDLVWQPPRT